MTTAPASLRSLGSYWEQQGGVNLGIVGDAAHQARGISYHLGKSALEPDAYSARTARDKAGLTEAASAIDLGRLDGSLGQLRAFSVWLVDEARHNAAGTSDMREIIYSPDGKTVLRWDRERGYDSEPRGGEADDSHLQHTHISWYRDAEDRDHTTAFRPYFEEPTMFPIRYPGNGRYGLVGVVADKTVYRLDGSGPVVVGSEGSGGWGASAIHDIPGGSAGFAYTSTASGVTYWVDKDDATFSAPAGACDDAVNEALDTVDAAVKVARP